MVMAFRPLAVMVYIMVCNKYDLHVVFYLYLVNLECNSSSFVSPLE
jgi:hypothetical protein